MLILPYLSLIAVRATHQLSEVISTARRLCENGNFTAAETLYTNSVPLFSDHQLFQKEYLEFLLKTGQYDKIISMKGVSPVLNDLVNTAKECKNKIKTGNPEIIAELLKISPASFKVLYMIARNALRTKNFGMFTCYLNSLKKLNKDANRTDKANRTNRTNITDSNTNTTNTENNTKDIAELEGLYSAYQGQYRRASDYFKEAGLMDITKQINLFLNKLEDIQESAGTSIQKVSAYKSLSGAITSKMIMDVYDPSIYRKMSYQVLTESLRMATENGIIGMAGEAIKLYNLEKNVETISLVIPVLLLDGRTGRAADLLEESKKILNSGIYKELAQQITAKKQKEQREQRERSQREQRDRSRYYRRNQREDYYQPPEVNDTKCYKVLGVKETATLPEIKKAYRKKKRSIKGNDKKSQEQLMELNKALETAEKRLSGKNESAHQGGQNRRGDEYGGYYGEQFGFGGGGFMDEDFGRMFENIFGNQRQRFYTYHF